MQSGLVIYPPGFLQWSALAESFEDAVLGLDLEGAIRSWNRGAQSLFGFSLEEVAGQPLSRIVPPDLHTDCVAMEKRARGGECADWLDTRALGKSGLSFGVRLRFRPIAYAEGGVFGVSVVAKTVEGDAAGGDAFRGLVWQLLRKQEEERRALARALHDSASQTLAALAMNLGVLAQGGATLQAERQQKLLGSCMALAQSAVQELRTTECLLYPTLLAERGLESAVRCLMGGLAESGALRADLEVADGFLRLPEAQELALFRVIEELLGNMARQRQPGRAKICLRRCATALEVEVRDGGSGLEAGSNGGAGLGIAGMNERLSQIGGTLRVLTGENGTLVTATVPIAQ